MIVMWSLYADQGQGFQPLAERQNPEKLKAVATEIHQQATNPETIRYRIYDSYGYLRFASSHNASWRMRWKRPRTTEMLKDLAA